VYSLANKLVEPAKILIIVGMAYTLATTGWYIVSGPSSAPVVAKNSATQATKSLSIDEVIGFEMFGKADAAAATPAVFDAPETRLKLTLEGVFQAEIPEESAAIVAEPGRPGELFLVGATLPGSVVLAEVHPDRIVLRRGNSFETLRFSDEPPLLTANDQSYAPDTPEAPPAEYYEEPAPIEEPPVEQPPDEPPPQASSAAETLNAYKQQLQQDPAGTLSNLGVSPVAEGAAQGYRLGNLAQSPALAQTGLQPGDVVLSVNGMPVGNIQQDRQQLDSVLAQGSARLEIQRGARRFFVTASLR
jgi:general secretion pathway protein C